MSKSRNNLSQLHPKKDDSNKTVINGGVGWLIFHQAATGLVKQMIHGDEPPWCVTVTTVILRRRQQIRIIA
ncbi:hypothetical protein V6N13_004151 [Hibiscus sabdariffa]|uniref:Uncharacterized protein n=1 Tax=Hibiscus sabdariffa TaxID=183260 RepID=A0ABR2RY53_9ROSI